MHGGLLLFLLAFFGSFSQRLKILMF